MQKYLEGFSEPQDQDNGFGWLSSVKLAADEISHDRANGRGISRGEL